MYQFYEALVPKVFLATKKCFGVSDPYLFCTDPILVFLFKKLTQSYKIFHKLFKFQHNRKPIKIDF
jgi:hypothetical protein